MARASRCSWMSSTTTPARAIISAHGELSRYRQSLVLPARRGRTTLLLRCHRDGQQPQRQQPDHAAADHRQPPLLGDRDARRRIQVRPCSGARRASSTTSTGSRAFFDIIHQDPVLSRVKLVAEPWDVGEGGYHVGNFPVRWRSGTAPIATPCGDFWRGAAGGVRDIANCLTGSSSLYQWDGRQPWASINFRDRPRRVHASRPGLL